MSGEIDLPLLGAIKVIDLTTNQISTLLEEKLKSFVVNPAVKTTILNFKFSVLGEVKNPQTFSVIDDKISIIQAIGMAGDLTINGDRSNITLLREVNGNFESTTIDLTSFDIISSAYYNLRQNDVIYVRPNTAKVKSSGIVGNVGTLTSVLSLLLSLGIILTLNMDSQFNQQDSIFDFKKEFNYYLFFWPIFLVSLVCFLAGAYIYLRYSTPLYQANATIQVKDRASDPSSFLSQSTQTMFNFRKLNIDNDIAVLTSSLILSKVVEDLDLQTRVYAIGNIRESLVFNGDAPFSIEFLNPIGKDQIDISISDDNYVLSYKDFIADIIPGEIIQNEDFIFYPNVDFKLTEDLRIQRIPLEFAVASLQGSISAEASTKLGDNISISITGPNKKRNEAIINSLIKITQSDQILDKQQIYSLSIDFIENRLNVLTQSLDSLNQETVSIKADNLIFTPEAQTTTALSNISKIEDESFKLSVQLDLANEIKRNLESSQGYSLLPSNVGIENVSVNQLIGSYNELVLQRNKLLTGATERNPLVEQLSSQLSEVKGNILQSVQNYISSIQNLYI